MSVIRGSATKVKTNAKGEKVIIDKRRKEHHAAIRLTDGKVHPVEVRFVEPRKR